MTAVLGWVGLRVVLPRLHLPVPGEHPPSGSPADADGSLSVERTSPEGVPYVCHNASATFDLDLQRPDRHSRHLFPSFASAGKYGREQGLELLPSTQMLLTRCRWLDQRLLASLEMALQQGIPGQKLAGMQELLRRLCGRLLEQHQAVPGGRRGQATAEAMVHVAAALELGGGLCPEVPATVRAGAEEARARFLAAPRLAKPIGGYAEDAYPALAGIFRQERFLYEGLPLDAAADAGAALCVALAGSPELTEALDRLNEVDRILTNPRLPDSLAPTAVIRRLGADRLAAGMASEAAFAQLVTELRVLAAEVTTTLPNRPPCLALSAYSESRENDLLARFEGGDSIEFVAAAVAAGALSLVPQPTSGWYDYQWYGLETLVLPERAQESPKLLLNALYRGHLRESFKVGLTAARETHVKALPVIVLGGGFGPPVKATVRPEFLVEPTATVYLRTARGYRFLREALRRTLGAEVLGAVPVVGSREPALSVDAEIERAMLCFYGIYDRLCRELGLPPAYEPGEVPADQAQRASQEARRLVDGIWDDPDLSRDCRMAAPILVAADLAHTQYWSIVGVKLMPLTCAYRQRPVVTEIEPIWEAAHVYLPVAVFAEFATTDKEPPTRTEFQARCDRFPAEGDLLRSLGAAPGVYAPPRPLWLRRVGLVLAGLLLLGAATVAWRLLPRGVTAKALRRTAVAAALAIVLGAALVLACPAWRTRFLVQYVGAAHPTLTHLSLRLVERQAARSPRAVTQALAQLLAHPDPQVRYAAVWILGNMEATWCDEGFWKALAEPGTGGALVRALSDPVPEIRAYVGMMFGGVTGLARAHAAALQRCLNDPVAAEATAAVLASIGEPRARDALLRLTQQPGQLHTEAWVALSYYAEPAVLQHVLDGAGAGISGARYGTQHWLHRYTHPGATDGFPVAPDPDTSATLDGILRERAGDLRLPLSLRLRLARAVRQPEARDLAWKELAASSHEIGDLQRGLDEVPAALLPGVHAVLAQICTILAPNHYNRGANDLSQWQGFSPAPDVPAERAPTPVPPARATPPDPTTVGELLVRLPLSISASPADVSSVLRWAEAPDADLSGPALAALREWGAGFQGYYRTSRGGNLGEGQADADRDAVLLQAIGDPALPLDLRLGLVRHVAGLPEHFAACRLVARDVPALAAMIQALARLDDASRRLLAEVVLNPPANPPP